MADKSLVDKGALKSLGAAGVIEVGNNVQAIFGPKAERLKDEIKGALCVEVVVVPTPQDATPVVADAYSRLLTSKPDGVLGLATGSTPWAFTASSSGGIGTRA